MSMSVARRAASCSFSMSSLVGHILDGSRSCNIIGREMLRSELGAAIRSVNPNVELKRIKAFVGQEPFCRICKSGDALSKPCERR